MHSVETVMLKLFFEQCMLGKYSELQVLHIIIAHVFIFTKNLHKNNFACANVFPQDGQTQKVTTSLWYRQVGITLLILYF